MLILKRVYAAYMGIFLFTVFSGAIRKWVVSSNAVGNVILLIQLFAPMLFLFFRKQMVQKVWLNRFLVFYLLVLILEAINPLNLTIYHGILGLLLHFNFWFGMFFYLENRDDFFLSKKSILVIIYVAAILMVLAFIQYQLPEGHFLNRYADVDKVGSIATVGNSVRVTGTFSYLSGFTSYLLFHIFLIWGLIRIKFNSIVILLLTLFGIVTAFMSGSRGAVYNYFILLFVIFICEYKRVNISKLLLSFFIPISIITLVILAKGATGLEEKVSIAFENFDSRRKEGQNSGEESKRILWDYQQLIDFRGNYPFAGVGLGSTYQGATTMFGTSDYVKEYGYYETEMSRYVLEGGFILLFFKIIMVVSLLRKLMLPLLAKIVIGILIISFAPVVYNIYNTIFIMLGLIFVDSLYYRPYFFNADSVSK